MAAEQNTAEASVPSPATSGKGKSPVKQDGKPTKRARLPPSKAGTPAKAVGTPTKPKNVKLSPDKVSKASNSDGNKTPFRFRWAKKNPNAQTIKIEQDESGADLPLPKSTGRAKAISAAKGTVAKTPDRNLEKSMKALIDFNMQSAGKSAIGESSARDEDSTAGATPKKRLLPAVPVHANDNDTEMRGVDESGKEKDIEPDENQYLSDENKKGESSDEEEYDPMDIKIAPKSSKKEIIGPYHPSVPRAVNNMEKAKMRAKSTSHDPNGRHAGRILVHWHRKYFSFLHPNNLQV